MVSSSHWLRPLSVPGELMAVRGVLVVVGLAVTSTGVLCVINFRHWVRSLHQLVTGSNEPPPKSRSSLQSVFSYLFFWSGPSSYPAFRTSAVLIGLFIVGAGLAILVTAL